MGELLSATYGCDALRGNTGSALSVCQPSVENDSLIIGNDDQEHALSMLIPELVKQAIAGRLQFDFIESTITAFDGQRLLSLQGRGHANPGDGWFHFHFHPRAPIPAEWTRSEYAVTAPRHGKRRHFRVEGVERGSARWTGKAPSLHYVQSSRGPAIHMRVGKWTCIDTRSARLSFTRVVIPGRLGYPVTVRHSTGLNERITTIDWNDVRLDFRDYKTHTEICASSMNRLPARFAESAINALGEMLGRSLTWVYREQHADNRRTISVQALPALNDGMSHVAPAPAYSASSQQKFWQAYAGRLDALVRESAPSIDVA